ncbi:hypothetical protein OUZ56_003997 [Daphnia magna]|uniref:Uncharacterized protein n=1 Tax=Daphnia magna TaxID=35525 RepID=A0ABQ9YNF7_9CRUS|nr:hypothetical protein OUZ56_003997 [Daphnia magna]
MEQVTDFSGLMRKLTTHVTSTPLFSVLLENFHSSRYKGDEEDEQAKRIQLTRRLFTYWIELERK